MSAVSTEVIGSNVADKKPQVRVEKLFHRGQNCLALFFPFNSELSSLVKKIEGIKWSQTNKCWYVAERVNLLSEIFTTFRGEAWIDITALKSNHEKEVSTTAEVEPLVALPIDQKSSPKVTVIESSEENLQLLRMMEQKLHLRGYSFNTNKTYLQQFKEFLRFYSHSPVADLSEGEIRNYMIYPVEHRKVSKSLQNQAVNAIKFFYEKVLMQERKVYYLERPMREKKLPEVLSQKS